MTRDEYEHKMKCSIALSESMLIAISYISSLEKHIAELSTPRTCGTCVWYNKKQCMNLNGIAFNGSNAIYEDDYCKDYTLKEIQ